MTNWNLLHTTQHTLQRQQMYQSEAEHARTQTRLLEADQQIQQVLVSSREKTLQARLTRLCSLLQKLLCRDAN